MRGSNSQNGRAHLTRIVGLILEEPPSHRNSRMHLKNLREGDRQLPTRSDSGLKLRVRDAEESWCLVPST